MAKYLTVANKREICNKIIDRKSDLLKLAMDVKAFEVGCNTDQMSEGEFKALCTKELNAQLITYIGIDIKNGR